MSLFTVLLPTTGDRGPLLPLVVGRVQMQSIDDWELFIIGDGVTSDTRTVINGLCRSDPRIHFFDHPKHPRRGEIYRHEALAHAQGTYVAYVCDRDLWLHDHLQTLADALADHDFAHTGRFTMRPDGSRLLNIHCDLKHPRHRRFLARRHLCPFALSSVGHTLAAYRRLPHGWRTTPPEFKTDHYMWKQFLADPACIATSLSWPTLLYFNRGNHPGLPTPERFREIEHWAKELPNVPSQDAFRANSLRTLQRPPQQSLHRLFSALWWYPKIFRVLSWSVAAAGLGLSRKRPLR